MRDQCAFDFGCPEAVTGDIYYIVNAARYPVISIFIAACTVAGEIETGVITEIGLLETFVVAVNRAKHARPRVLDHEVTGARPLDRGPSGVIIAG